MIGTHLPVHGIGIHMVGNQPQSITVHKQTVALRIVDSYGTFGGNGASGQFVVETVVASQHVPVDRIIHLYIVKSLTVSQDAVVEKAVTGQFLAVVGQYGTVEQFCLLSSRIVHATFGINMILITHNVGGT